MKIIEKAIKFISKRKKRKEKIEIEGPNGIIRGKFVKI